LKTFKWLLIVLVLALVVVYYIFGKDYLGQRDEKASLASEITRAEKVLAELPPSAAGLDERLSAARAELEAARDAFPESLYTTRIIEFVMKNAEECGVKAVPLLSQPGALENISGYNYPVFNLNVHTSSTYLQLIDFLTRLEAGEIETLVLEHVSLVITPEVPPERDNPSGDIPIDASVDIAVYSRPDLAVPAGGVKLQ
jgi:hypothetical protein